MPDPYPPLTANCTKALIAGLVVIACNFTQHVDRSCRFSAPCSAGPPSIVVLCNPSLRLSPFLLQLVSPYSDNPSIKEAGNNKLIWLGLPLNVSDDVLPCWIFILFRIEEHGFVHDSCTQNSIIQTLDVCLSNELFNAGNFGSVTTANINAICNVIY